MIPSTPIRCESLNATNPASTCAARHLKRGHLDIHKHILKFPMCAGCPLGRAAAQQLLALGWRPPGKRTDPRVAANRVARRRWHAEHWQTPGVLG